ncbi:hypothetical protein L873DRAFT_880710 [Choiromyces venosus 120613-1]|uniref:Uncharacterized protein n=1 Tax=Choiromyces venosus 120613-1 TaxID=1336337 RepID=A0A3N4JNC0_9PEZI|nr:hypothetical protein L873DRAFT_880710 [Choiromyces venosus 120613-1]
MKRTPRKPVTTETRIKYPFSTTSTKSFKVVPLPEALPDFRNKRADLIPTFPMIPQKLYLPPGSSLLSFLSPLLPIFLLTYQPLPPHR